MPHLTARLTNLDSATTVEEIKELFTSKGFSICPGQAQISLATSLEGSKVATVTFRDEESLSRAMKLPPQDRELHGERITLDVAFEGFTTLSDGDGVDIIALHGLNGHAFDTWQNLSNDDYFMWLRDILPKHFPAARILTYGYNANVVTDISTTRLRSFAENLLEKLRLERNDENQLHKPLIFMAYSLGGLIIKQALIVGRNYADMRYENILESVRAIMFFGTPHQGGSGVSVADFVGTILRAVNVETRQDLIRELNPDSLFLFDLTGDFRQVIDARRIAIYTFFESKKTRIGVKFFIKHDVLVVKEQSATLGVAQERKVAVNANHANLCKFGGPGDVDYDSVRRALQELITESMPRIAAGDVSTQPPPPPDLKYASITDDDGLGDERNYPVLVWGQYTYWALSHIDNRYGMVILAYDKQGRMVKRWEKLGGRYVQRIELRRGSVHFIGQSGYQITFSLRDLRM